MGYKVEDVTKNPLELIAKELLEYQQDPKTHHIINTLMKLNPTQYMLSLAKEGEKFHSTFNLQLENNLWEMWLLFLKLPSHNPWYKV